MNEQEAEWIGHEGFAYHLVIWGTEDKDFKVGPSALFGAASLSRSWLLMSRCLGFMSNFSLCLGVPDPALLA